MELLITFGSGKKVIADFNGHNIATDQPVRAGGENSAPTPFDLFIASLGTCAGIFVKSFCDQRNINTEGISLVQKMDFNQNTHLISSVSIEINLPSGFPEKYKEAVVNAAELCTVKRHLHNPPQMSVTAIIK